MDGMVANHLPHVPTWVLIPMAYQLTSRISDASGKDATTFDKTLAELVYCMCVRHPFHTLLHVLALKNGDRVRGRLGLGLGLSVVLQSVVCGRALAGK